MGEASKQHELQVQQQGFENQLNDQKHQSMLLNNRRAQLEIIRQNQRAQAMAVSSASNQGAMFSSGLAGGLSQVQGQSNLNMLGQNQGFDFGENAFSINRSISGIRNQISESQSRQATDQGISSLGNTVGRAGPTISSLGQNFFGGFGSGK